MSIYLAGIIGGLVGGVVFGMMMAKMKMLPMVAKLLGGSSAGGGFFIHLTISAIFGLVYVWAAPYFFDISVVGQGIIAGLIFGFIWWILGANIIMPAWLKIQAMWSKKGLMGHLIYGVLLGLVVSWLL